MIKQIMIPVAAFAVTATGASAFSAEMFEKLDINLSTEQVAALEEAHELRQAGADKSEVKEILEEAGLDRETMREIKEAAHSHRAEMRASIHEAIENGDYSAYLSLVEGTPRADLIDSEDDFEKLMEAHELREAGDREGAREIMSELGFEKPAGHRHGKQGGKQGGEQRGFGGPGLETVS